MKLESDALKLDGLAHGFFTREGGISEGIYAGLNIGLGSDDKREHVLENRNRVAATFGTDAAQLVSPYQIHSPDVIAIDAPFTAEADRKADALVTASPGLVLGISTADCGPVLFADPQAGVIGAAHAGWKGAVSGVLKNTVTAMETLGASRSNITAVLGPTISQTAYEVGPEFQQRFQDENSGNTIYFTASERPDHFMFDLPAFITDRLGALGLKSVSNMALCTYSDEHRFFSYRRTTHRQEPDYGRQISAIAIL